ncbi:hypothetical protein [Cytobacillus gottheilii]|uniref:Uncharacterized protein n=1 Tax=Cytobacillus gottheilii TaxID=859144 RepID=A0ABX8FIV8_9BACI|nr:hypothetical protein [Cytobacillus gottheilii]QVY63947.1 hypothetical protein J1899_22500 [Cytobacillus gottheilii]
MGTWGNMIVAEINSAKTYLLLIFVAIGTVSIVIHGIKYKSGTDDEKLDAKKAIRGSVLWFMGLPFALWLATYLYTKASGIA